MARKVKVELTQPVGDPDGKIVYQPGTQFVEDDPALDDLPPGHVRYILVEVLDEPKPEPEVKRGPGRPPKIDK